MILTSRQVGIKIVIIYIFIIYLNTSCAGNNITSTQAVLTNPVPTETETIIPEPPHTQTPTSTLPPTSTITPTPSITSTPQPTSTSTSIPTMTPFPTLDYIVEYPFNTSGLTLEEMRHLALSRFVWYMYQEKLFYESWGIPKNHTLDSYPDTMWQRIDKVEELSLPVFCRFYPYAKLIHLPVIMERDHFSLDYTFAEAQTLVGIDCSTVNISMFP